MSIINTAIIQKLRKLKANVAEVLTKTNTITYTPTADYHPATKKYVDDLFASTSAGANDTVYTSIIETTDVVILSTAPITRTIRFFVQAQNTATGEVYTSELNIMMDKSDNVHLSEQGVVYTGSEPFISFSAILLAEEVTLTAVATTDDQIIIKFIRNILSDFPEIAISAGTTPKTISTLTKSSTTFVNYEIVIQDTSTDYLQKSNIILIWDGIDAYFTEKDVILSNNTYVGWNNIDASDPNYIKLVTTPQQTDQTIYRVARLYNSVALETTSTSTTDATAIYSYDLISYRTVLYKIRVSDTTNENYQYTEFTVTTDGTDVYQTEHTTLTTNGEFVAFSNSINNGNMELIATPTVSDEITYEMAIKVIEA